MTNITRRSALTFLGSGMAALGLAACGGSNGNDAANGSADANADTSAATDSADKTFKIGVLQLVEHDALDASNKGFVDALDEAGIKYEIDQQNAQGDQSACQTIAAKLVGDEDDLILAIATPAVEACAGATEDIPIVGTAVTDFAASGLVESNDAPGGNITGSSDLTPVEDQIKMLNTVLPDVKTVGVLWCTAESNSDLQAQMAKDACEKLGLTATDYTVSSSNEIQSVVESMAGKVDAIYTPTDNTIAAGMSTVTMVADDNNIPVIAGEQGEFEAGALCTYTISYYELGKLAGQMAVRILTEGESPATMPIEYYPSDKLELLYDEEKAKALGIDPDLWSTLG
ncbi:MAG: ABC transporter substrate-binding protein [Atopobiaceae bacterium]|jgi:putative ABC transport system substrate-binding protein|nr:ABC transporter substrate-binding protein [Atopobiaceae bacterium]